MAGATKDGGGAGWSRWLSLHTNGVYDCLYVLARNPTALASCGVLLELVVCLQVSGRRTCCLVRGPRSNDLLVPAHTFSAFIAC
jgi:hypothetical protein